MSDPEVERGEVGPCREQFATDSATTTPQSILERTVSFDFISDDMTLLQATMAAARSLRRKKASGSSWKSRTSTTNPLMDVDLLQQQNNEARML